MKHSLPGGTFLTCSHSLLNEVAVTMTWEGEKNYFNLGIWFPEKKPLSWAKKVTLEVFTSFAFSTYRVWSHRSFAFPAASAHELHPQLLLLVLIVQGRRRKQQGGGETLIDEKGPTISMNSMEINLTSPNCNYFSKIFKTEINWPSVTAF